VNDVITMEPNMDETVRSSEVHLSQGEAIAADEVRSDSPGGSQTEAVERVRVNFRVAWGVNPLLARDLMRFPPGKPRHARLLTLLTLGLFLEAEMLSGGAAQHSSVDNDSQAGENENLKLLRRRGGD
jgi:hypothetical protein